MSDPEDFIEDDGDLFGDEDEDAQPERQLSDKELDSGDDEDRDDRRDADDMDTDPRDNEPTLREARILDMRIGRQTVPVPVDNQIHTFRLPAFLGIDPLPYDSSTFQVPTADHHTNEQSQDFSALEVAKTTIRYQKDPSSGELVSNTYISRWSDGTATLHIGDIDYELLSKPLCQTDRSKPYDPKADSHQYLATPHAESSALQVVGHITNQYTVMANKQIADAALTRLTSALMATKKARLNLNGDKDTGMQVITQTQDPELQKKEAELAEKEQAKAQRRREAAAQKAEYGLGRGGRLGGLDDLEGRSGRLPPLKKKRTAPSGPKRRRKRADYSSDEDEGRPGRSREDEYDLDDGFLAGSDEEIEEEGSEDDIDDGIVESPKAKSSKPKAKKQKRDSSEDEEEDEDADADADGDDVDAEGEPDDDAPVADAGGRRKRNVIEDDDDDDE